MILLFTLILEVTDYTLNPTGLNPMTALLSNSTLAEDKICTPQPRPPCRAELEILLFPRIAFSHLSAALYVSLYEQL